jgi:uncharacterized protein YceK
VLGYFGEVVCQRVENIAEMPFDRILDTYQVFLPNNILNRKSTTPMYSKKEG